MISLSIITKKNRRSQTERPTSGDWQCDEVENLRTVNDAVPALVELALHFHASDVAVGDRCSARTAVIRKNDAVIRC